MLNKYAIAVSTAALVAATAASAETEATATVDLNLRAEPSEFGAVVGVIPAEAKVMVEACADTVNWCKVNFDGTQGWAFGDYLVTPVGQEVAALSQPSAQTTITRVEVTDTRAASAAGGGTMGAVIGGALGGPVGLAAGAAIGAGLGAATDPGPQVTSYVVENPVDPIFLDGEVVVGASLPDTVELYTIPESEFSYVYVNGVPAVIEPGERKIVSIVR